MTDKERAHDTYEQYGSGGGKGMKDAETNEQIKVLISEAIKETRADALKSYKELQRAGLEDGEARIFIVFPKNEGEMFNLSVRDAADVLKVILDKRGEKPSDGLYHFFTGEPFSCGSCKVNISDPKQLIHIAQVYETNPLRIIACIAEAQK